VLKLLGVYAQGVVAGGAYESIATVTATGTESTITFSSIPSTYQHLQIRALSRDTFTAINGVSTIGMRTLGTSW
jgi:hypothetical protein